MPAEQKPRAGGPEAQPGRQLRLGLRDGLADGWAIANDETLADLVRTRASGLQMFHVLVYIAMWGRYRDSTGVPPPSNRQLAAALKANPRTVDRYRQRFEDAFPELEDPGPLYDAARGAVGADDDPELAAVKLGGATL